MTVLLDGKSLAKTKVSELNSAISKHSLLKKHPPHLVALLVGDNAASEVYVDNKVKACKRAAIQSTVLRHDSNLSEQELLAIIDELNNDANVDGILIQLPLPTHISTPKIIEAVAPEKDVDGFHPYNVGCLATRQPRLRPCTPYGIIQLLLAYEIELSGLNATVLGASNIVGRPMVLELLLAGATVTCCHSQTQALETHIENADLLISATGKPDLFDINLIKPNAIVVDVGIHRQENGKLRGDLDFNGLYGKVSHLTPVPGGVGPMTVATLLQNTYVAALRQRNY